MRIKSITAIGLKRLDGYAKAFELYNQLRYDDKIIIEVLFYVGRTIYCKEVRLPKSKGDRILNTVTLCVDQMEYGGLNFGKKVENYQLNIFGKQASSIVENVERTMAIIGEFNLEKF